jgi:hypothetical protein
MRFLALAAALVLTPDLAARADTTAILRDQGIAAALQAGLARDGFERGSLLVLRAVETALQTAARHGLTDRAAQMLAMRPPRGRLPRGVEPAAPDTLSRLTATLLADLAAARAELATDTTPFVLDLNAVWFDLDADGRRGQGEGAAEMLLPAILPRPDLNAQAEALTTRPLEVRFDEADRDWLVAYTHMVAGMGHLLLAFDPTPVLRDLAEGQARLAMLPVVPDYYDRDALRARLPGLEARANDLREQEKSLRDALQPLQDRRITLFDRARATADPAAKTAIEAELGAVIAEMEPMQRNALSLVRERRAAAAELQSIRRILNEPAISDRTPGDAAADMLRDPLTVLHVVVAALRQPPDAAQVQAVRDHWLAMIAANRRLWAAVAAETDNDREWIPNDAQQSALPVTLEPGTAEAWLTVLDEAEAVLQGRLLLPHPLLPQGVGINLASWFDAPGPVDVLAWVQGVGALPHAARGPQISALSWQRFGALAQGRAGALALWFN